VAAQLVAAEAESPMIAMRIGAMDSCWEDTTLPRFKPGESSIYKQKLELTNGPCG
jgi:hypothetical protein